MKEQLKTARAPPSRHDSAIVQRGSKPGRFRLLHCKTPTSLSARLPSHAERERDVSITNNFLASQLLRDCWRRECTWAWGPLGMCLLCLEDNPTLLGEVGVRKVNVIMFRTEKMDLELVHQFPMQSETGENFRWTRLHCHASSTLSLSMTWRNSIHSWKTNTCRFVFA